MKIVYSRDQKIKGSLTGDFDKDYAFLEAVFERSGDIVKNPFCIAEFLPGGGNLCRWHDGCGYGRRFCDSSAS